MCKYINEMILELLLKMFTPISDIVKQILRLISHGFLPSFSWRNVTIFFSKHCIFDLLPKHVKESYCLHMCCFVYWLKMLKWPLQCFTCNTTAVLSWHVQKYCCGLIVNNRFTARRSFHRIWITSKIVSETGLWITNAYVVVDKICAIFTIIINAWHAQDIYTWKLLTELANPVLMSCLRGSMRTQTIE